MAANPGADERRALDEAALWYARLIPGARDLGESPQALRDGLARWLAAHPGNRSAWDQVQRVSARLEGIPGSLAASVPQRAPRAGRRHVLRGAAWATVGGTVAWLGWRHLPGAPWQPQVATGPGERRTIALSDGGTLHLDTHTALDVDYGDGLRRLRLREGAILVSTHADDQAPPRPFVVDTPQGRILALGTRFEVRALAPGISEVAVLEHAVQVTLADTSADTPGLAHTVHAGERLRFGSRSAEPVQAASPDAGAWVRGQLIVTDQPLAEVLAELARYRRGWLGCDPAVAGLRISGVLPLHDTDQALATLEDGFPLRVERQWNGWRTRVVAR